jgi:hypothetical protein
MIRNRELAKISRDKKKQEEINTKLENAALRLDIEELKRSNLDLKEKNEDLQSINILVVQKLRKLQAMLLDELEMKDVSAAE